MKYSQFGKTGMKVSRFGLGCMRFPSDEKEAIEMVSYAKLYNSQQLMKSHVIDTVVYKNSFVPAGLGADQCVSCEICSGHCPQSLEIPELLKKVHAEFMK